MNKTSKAFLLINVLLLIGNVRLWFWMAQGNARYDQKLKNREADVVLKEFIINAASNKKDFPFRVGENHVSYEPSQMVGPYTIEKYDQYTYSWMYRVHFETGFTYRAEVWRPDSGEWLLHTFEVD